MGALFPANKPGISLRDLYFNAPAPPQALQAPQRTLAQRVNDAVAGAGRKVGLSGRNAKKVANLADLSAVGNIASAFDAGADLRKGNYLQGTLGALLSVLPVPGVEKRAGAGILSAMADQFKVKPPRRLYRGLTVNTDDTVGMGDFFLGKGFYSSPSREYAQRYAMTRGADMQLTPNGAIQELSPEDAFPRNPLVLSGQNDAGAVFRDWLMKQTGLRASEISQRWPDPGEYVRSLGYDGVVIGDEVVRYK